MGDLIHPFQCIEAAKPPPTDENSLGYLLAACGPKLVSVRLDDGEIVAQWTAESSSGSAEANDDGEAQERPAKKQKTSSSPANLPNVIQLALAPDHERAVVVTDDKCLRVFDVDSDGKIVELSQRFMPKRPCAVRIPDKVTILCADKFGDVYALPLLPEAPRRAGGPEEEVEPSYLPDESKITFKPSASNLTVHTQRNRRALEAQLKQKNFTPKSKEPLKFEHKLLLGHVSMLTDLDWGTQKVDGKERGYIVTADRDEHIRISRGPPQSHIIEGYCLGHKEFVSKALVLPGTNLMVSGGGDDWLGIWDWTNFKLLRKIDDFGANVRQAALLPGVDPQSISIAVSGIWIVPGHLPGKKVSFLAVACENLPVLAWIPCLELLKPNGEKMEWNVQTMARPVLDITSVDDHVFISFDERGPGVQRIEPKLPLHIRGAFATVSSVDIEFKKSLVQLNKVTSTVSSEKSLNGFLYGMENLRKRTYKYREEEDQEQEET